MASTTTSKGQMTSWWPFCHWRIFWFLMPWCLMMFEGLNVMVSPRGESYFVASRAAISFAFSMVPARLIASAMTYTAQ